MADDAELKLDNGGGKKKLFIIIGAVVLLVVVGVVVFMMMGSSEPQESEQTQQLLAESNKIFYVSIPSPIVLKVVSKPKGHIMQLRLSLMVRGEENKKLAEHHLPAILSAISSSLYDLDFAEVQTPEGKEKIKETALKSVQSKLKQLENKPVVEKVLYDGFIIQ
ncbi:MAG: flagellar basal body-associated FliL family protein [Succinivibrionaceae bacterium]|jgi:flagellar FliL protein|nr:flagellar basal body-associated FliL family protein [Succinivibrionaceae bacterium]